MKRKLFTFLMAFLAIAGNAVWAETYNLANMSGETTISGGEHTITGTATQDVRFTITGNATITLDNANFGCARGSGIGGLVANNCPIELQGNGTILTLILTGNNSIESKPYGLGGTYERAAGIYVPGNTKLVVAEQSTGQLTVTGRVAIGTNLLDLGNMSCGEIEILGGTVVAIGNSTSGNYDAVSVGGGSFLTGSTSGSIVVDNDGVLIAAQNVTVPEEDVHFNGGILFNGSTEGTVIGGQEVELKSPLDLDNLTLTVPSNSTLRLGEGKKIDNAEHLVIEGTVIGYKFEYKTGTENTSFTGSFSTPIPSTFYCGPNTPYEVRDWTSDNITVPNKGQYQRVDGWWLDNNNNWVKAENKTTPSTAISDLQTTAFTGTWVIADRTIAYKADATLAQNVYLWWPTNAPFSASESSTTSGKLDEAGLQISGHELQKKNDYYPTAGTYNTEISITPTDANGASTLTAKVAAVVTQDPISLNSDRITFEMQASATYDGNAVDNTEIVKIFMDKDDHPDMAAIDGLLYEICYKKDGEENWGSWGTNPKNAGTYSIKVKGKNNNGNSVFTTEEKELTDLFTINPASLTATAKNQTINWNILETEKKPTLTDNYTLSGVVGDDDAQIKAEASVAAGEGSTGTDWESTPGTYTVTLTYTCSNNNYTAPAATTFTLNVYKYYDEEGGETPKFPDELKPGDEKDDTWTWNADDETFETTYDGTAKAIEKITLNGVAILKAEGPLSAENQGFTVTYKQKGQDGQTTDIDNAPVNAGNYIAILDIFYNNEGGKGIEMPLRINPAILTATATDVEWTIGETEPDFAGKVSIDEDDLFSQGEEKDEVSVTIGTTPTGSWTLAGTYKVTYSSLSLTGSDAGNYKLEKDEVTGKLVVTKSGDITDTGDEGDIKVDDNKEGEGGSGWTWDSDNSRYTREYDGQPHPLAAANTIWVKQQKEGDEGTEWKPVPVNNLEISYKYKLDESSEEVTDNVVVKNAGTYTATVKITGTPEGINYSDATATITLVITPKPVDVNIKKFTAADLSKTTITAEDVEMELVADESLNVSGTVTFAEKEDEDAETTTYTATFSELKLVDKDSYLASNYTATFKYNGTEITTQSPSVEVPIDEVEGDVTLPEADGWGTDFTRTYDGQSHNITKVIIDETEEDVTDKVTYQYKESETASEETVTDVKDAGTYVATITTTKGVATLTLKIEPKELKITINDQTIEADGTGFDANGFTVKTGVENETVTVTGTLTYTKPVEAGTVYESVITVNGTLNMYPDNKNYTIPTTIAAGDLTVKAEVPTTSEDDPIVDPDDPKLEGIELEGWENLSRVYDGESHGLTNLTVTLTNGEETTISVSTTFTPSEVKNVGTYTAAITIKNGSDVIETGTFHVQLSITKRPMQIAFKLPATIENTDPIAITTAHLNPETESTGRGLLQKEAPLAVESGQFIFGKPNAQGECSVSIRNFKLDDTDKFLANNYQVQIWNPETGEWEDYNPNNGEDVTIIDPDSDYANENPNNPGGGDSGVVVDPDGGSDDDNDDPNHGGNPGDINRPAKYYNIYVDTAATCDGVELSFSKNVVREGNQVSVYVDKILEGYNADDMKLWFKRSLYGYWEELEEGVQPGEYIIYNVYTDIYVKATDVEKNPTGIEEIEGVKVYAQDGSLYVYTPSRLPVWIISMTGAVVRNEEQIGLQQYDRLNRGIYIVRVGEQIFKLKL